MNGTTLVLTYDETLDDASVPAVGDFVVQSGGNTINVSQVSVDGSKSDADAGRPRAAQPGGVARLHAGGEPDSGRFGKRRGAALGART